MASADLPAPHNNGEAYEQQHVHEVYEQIASHFSSTRYKPWPIVERFLEELPPGSVGLDIGCGNGKYLAVNRNVFIVGSDRSTSLVSIASQHEPHTCIVSDILDLPHPGARFDFAICIAVIHHLSTPERRTAAIAAILDTLRVLRESTSRERKSDEPVSLRTETRSRALLYVWALEQQNSRRGWTAESEQDVMVPWVLTDRAPKRKKAEKGPDGKGVEVGEQHRATEVQSSDPAETAEPKTFHRYYHLYRKGELEQSVLQAGGEVLESGYEKDNWWAIVSKRT